MQFYDNKRQILPLIFNMNREINYIPMDLLAFSFVVNEVLMGFVIDWKINKFEKKKSLITTWPRVDVFCLRQN